ncbi:MAG: DUF2007 domain-containing protein [Bacteroidales bacterium]
MKMFVVVYDGTLFHAHMIKNLLENEGIESFLKDEIIGSRSGELWKLEGGVKVVVSNNNFKKALQIVENYDRSLK